MRGTKVTLLDGKERVLWFNLNALQEIGDRLDIRIRLGHIQQDLLDTPLPLGAVKVILYCGLQHDKEANPESLEEIGRLADVQSLPELILDFFGQFSAMWQGRAGEKRQELEEALRREEEEQETEEREPSVAV